MLATAQQLLTASGYQPIDKFGFDADDYAAVEKFLAADPDTPEPDDCPLCGDTLECPMHDLDDGFGV